MFDDLHHCSQGRKLGSTGEDGQKLGQRLPIYLDPVNWAHKKGIKVYTIMYHPLGPLSAFLWENLGVKVYKSDMFWMCLELPQIWVRIQKVQWNVHERHALILTLWVGYSVEWLSNCFSRRQTHNFCASFAKADVLQMGTLYTKCVEADFFLVQVCVRNLAAWGSWAHQSNWALGFCR